MTWFYNGVNDIVSLEAGLGGGQLLLLGSFLKLNQFRINTTTAFIHVKINISRQ
jgi:hypothetical protein